MPNSVDNKGLDVLSKSSQGQVTLCGLLLYIYVLALNIKYPIKQYYILSIWYTFIWASLVAQ